MSKLDQLLRLLAMIDETPTAATSPTDARIGKPVIVRSRDAGVIFGEFLGRDGDCVMLRDARQLWSWKAAQGGTLIDVARYGASDGKFSGASCGSVEVVNACTVIECSDEAAANLRGRDSKGAWK
jgi:hypothetical protein